MINWYIVQTFSGFEQKVAETLKETIKKKELSDKINEVLVPMHEVTVVTKGKRVQKKKKYFPSYILVKMEMTKELYHMIKNIQKVTGFLGTTGTPVPGGLNYWQVNETIRTLFNAPNAVVVSADVNEIGVQKDSPLTQFTAAMLATNVVSSHAFARKNGMWKALETRSGPNRQATDFRGFSQSNGGE